VAYKLRSSFPLNIESEELPSHPYDYLIVKKDLNQQNEDKCTVSNSSVECTSSNDIDYRNQTIAETIRNN